MALVILLDYRTPEQKAAARADLEPAGPEPVVIIVTDEEANQAKQWLDALGGRDNVESVDLVAETRLRVHVKDSAHVDVGALERAGLAGAVQVAPNVWHLVAGLDAAQYGTAMNRRFAHVSA